MCTEQQRASSDTKVPGFMKIRSLTREGPQVCPGDFNENDIGLSSEVYLSQA